MSKIKEILDGWGNLIKDVFNTLDEETKQMGEKGLSICNDCAVRDGFICSSNKQDWDKTTNEIKKGCGCQVFAKTLSPTSTCPLNKW